MPRSSTCFSMPGCASWLLAAPQMIFARQHLEHLVADRTAHRARGVDVDLARDELVGRGDGLDLRVLRADRLHRGGVDVGDDDGRAVLDQVAHEVAPDLADAGDADGAAGEGGLAPDLLGGGAHALERAVRREHRAVARAAVRDGAAGDEVALARDVVHVLAERADVARGEVAPVERLDEAAVGAQQGLGLQLGRVTDDDGLAATEVEAGERVLVGHAAREVEHVDDRVVGAGVGVEPRPAEGRAQRRGVDRDDGPAGRSRGRCRRRPARARLPSSKTSTPELCAPDMLVILFWWVRPRGVRTWSERSRGGDRRHVQRSRRRDSPRTASAPGRRGSRSRAASRRRACRRRSPSATPPSTSRERGPRQVGRVRRVERARARPWRGRRPGSGRAARAASRARRWPAPPARRRPRRSVVPSVAARSAAAPSSRRSSSVGPAASAGWKSKNRRALTKPTSHSPSRRTRCGSQVAIDPRPSVGSGSSRVSSTWVPCSRSASDSARVTRNPAGVRRPARVVGVSKSPHVLVATSQRPSLRTRWVAWSPKTPGRSGRRKNRSAECSTSSASGSSRHTLVCAVSKNPGPAEVAVSHRAPPSRSGRPSSSVTNRTSRSPSWPNAAGDAAAVGELDRRARQRRLVAGVEPLAQVVPGAGDPRARLAGPGRHVRPGQAQAEAGRFARRGGSAGSGARVPAPR